MSTTDVLAGTCIANERILSFWGSISGSPLPLTYFITLCGNDSTQTQAGSPLQTYLAVNIPRNPLLKTKDIDEAGSATLSTTFVIYICLRRTSSMNSVK